MKNSGKWIAVGLLLCIAAPSFAHGHEPGHGNDGVRLAGDIVRLVGNSIFAVKTAAVSPVVVTQPAVVTQPVVVTQPAAVTQPVVVTQPAVVVAQPAVMAIPPPHHGHGHGPGHRR